MWRRTGGLPAGPGTVRSLTSAMGSGLGTIPARAVSRNILACVTLVFEMSGTPSASIRSVSNLADEP